MFSEAAFEPVGLGDWCAVLAIHPLFYSTGFLEALLWARHHAKFCPSVGAGPQARHLLSWPSVSPFVKSRSLCLIT